MNRKNIYIGLLIGMCFFIGVTIAVKMYNKPHVDVEKQTAHFQKTSQDLLNEFENDEALANLTYLEKVIEVSGMISEINLEGSNIIVILAAENDFGSVQCHFKLDKKEEVSHLEINKNVKIKGVCTGYLMDVILVSSVIIN